MRRLFRLLSCAFLACVAVLAVGGFFLIRAAYFGTPRAGLPVSINIPRDDLDAQTVGDLLEKKGVISSAKTYRFYVWFDSRATHAKVGTYELFPGTNLREIARILAVGPVRSESRLTVIEGWTLADEQAYLRAEKKVDPKAFVDIAGAVANATPMRPDKHSSFDFLRSLPLERSLEGYLFPETYRVWDDELPDGLIEKQLHEFEKRFGTVRVDYQNSAPLKTLDEVVTLASIVEKEVKSDKDRKIVAGIFLRRLKEKMPLQSDATLTYVTGSTRGRATAEELAKDSPYNSYKNRGLPPGPICNPGETAIQAVLDPTASDYRYFLTDSEGKVLYASTFEGHLRNKRQAGY